MSLRVFLVLSMFACIAGCTEHSLPNIEEILGTNKSVVSECGGFQIELSDLNYTARDVQSSKDNCSKEQLFWWYDVQTLELKLLHSCVNLNCCGIREISAEQINNIYHIVERDDPDPNRCRCNCEFDFAVNQKDVSPGKITLLLKRTSKDYDDVEIWKGIIDLSKLYGQINI